jgi:O-antigen/teichoic acid export membrane protein
MWVRINRVVGSVTIPAIVGIVLVAPEFVDVVLGQRWDGTVPVIRALGWIAILQSLQTLNSGILQARNRTGTLLRFSIMALISNLVAVVAGLPWGIVGVAVALALASTVVEPTLTWLTARTLGVSALALPRALWGVVQATLAMAAAVTAVRALLSPDLPAVGVLALLVATGVVVYVPVCAWRAPEVVDEVGSLIRRRRRAAVTEPQPARP